MSWRIASLAIKAWFQGMVSRNDPLRASCLAVTVCSQSDCFARSDLLWLVNAGTLSSQVNLGYHFGALEASHGVVFRGSHAISSRYLKHFMERLCKGWILDSPLRL
jgi:hypothetical protein